MRAVAWRPRSTLIAGVVDLLLPYSDSKVFGGAEAVFCDIVAGLRRRPAFEVAAAAPASNDDLSARLRGPGGEEPLVRTRAGAAAGRVRQWRQDHRLNFFPKGLLDLVRLLCVLRGIARTCRLPFSESAVG